MPSKAKIAQQKYELVSLDRVQPHPRNPRRGSLDLIHSSIAKNDFYGAIIVQRSTGNILAGNHRYLGARQAGLSKLPVIWVDCSDEEALRILLVDNRASDVAGYDNALLTSLLSEIQDEAGSLDGTGFDEATFDALLAEVTAEPSSGGGNTPAQGRTDEDAAPALPAVPSTVLGDVWLLGAHRLACGSALVAEDLQRLLGADVGAVDLVFTDPPYNVDYSGYTKEALTIQNDKMTPAQFRDFLAATFASYRSILKPGASIYVCHPSSWQREFQNAMEAAGLEVRCQIIWAKNTFAWGFGRYKFQHEPMFYAHVAGKSDPWYGDKSQSTLWQEKKPAANRLHPTMKPVELVERALVNSSKAGDLVADLFGCSGSTLIACERLTRRARLMELDPKYCDVIVRRWQEFTGKSAMHEKGQAFDDLAEERKAVAA